MHIPDYYTVLGLPRDCDGEAIYQSFVEKTMDVQEAATQSDEKAIAHYTELHAAYEVLQDSFIRRIFDQCLAVDDTSRDHVSVRVILERAEHGRLIAWKNLDKRKETKIPRSRYNEALSDIFDFFTDW